ncbi:Fe(3+) ABC transporter substrate-binding protein [Bdellovibrio bacteriovorus]|uniref:Fe(3+) ABC transporter substrate-binding protein n=1 Tax=Bdellovibrio bacteriovorus TaxID=959 RepID=UPI003AA7B8DA
MRILSAIVTLLAAVTVQAKTDKLVLYSSYDGERLAPILQPFTQATGIEVEVVFASSTDLLKKLETEGLNSSADLYLDKDIVYMGEANRKGFLQSFTSNGVTQKVPSHLISDDKNWFLLFYRARTVMYNTQKVNPEDLKTYADLGDPKWKGQLCLRTSKNSYNEAMAAYFIKHFGEIQTTALLESWVKNLAVEPLKGDRDVIAAIANGTCAIGVANTYYLAPIVRDDVTYPVGVRFLEQDKVGAHINGVGIGITKSSKNTVAANAFLEFMVSKPVQEAVAGGFSQYPASKEADMAPILKEFGGFAEDMTNVNAVSDLVPAGIELMKKAGYK